MRNLILGTENSTANLILRLALGIVIFPHGAQKVLGWFGGYGLSATLNAFTEQMGIPLVFAILAITAEFLGSIGLIVGFLTRIAALGIGSVMVVAVLMVHLHNGFFMNWNGTQAGEGFEFHILAVSMALALIVSGGGRWSIDRWLSRKR